MSKSTTKKSTAVKKVTKVEMVETRVHPLSPGTLVPKFDIAGGFHQEANSKPSLKDVLAGTGEAVQKAVAERTAARLATDAKTKPAKVEKKTAAKAKKSTTEKKETLASFMRRLITDGRNNEEVFEAAVKEFGIGAEKKSYPSWYRSEMKRKSNAARAEAKKASGAPKKDLPKVEKVPTKKASAKA